MYLLFQNLLQAWFYSRSGKCYWAPGTALAHLAKPGRKSLHQVGTFIPGQVSGARSLCGAPAELMHPPDLS